ncbi:MAG: hypothetical protein ACREBI_06280 [Nitrosotalea sp.]
MVNEKRIAVIHIFHTTAVTIGAVLLAIGILFYSLEFEWIQAALSVMPESQVLKEDTGELIFSSWFYGGIGGIVIFISTLISTMLIRKTK